MTRDDRAISQWDDHSPNIEGETNPFWLYIYTVPVYYNIYISTHNNNNDNNV